MTIKFWSFSSAQSYDKCPKAIEHRYVLKTPKDARDNSAAERGTAIHKELEEYLASNTVGVRPNTIASPLETSSTLTRAPIDPAQFKYEGLVGKIKELCDQYPFTQEQMLFFDQNWNPVATFQEAWLLAAMDVFINISDEECIIVDWKTGKKEGNEIKHQQQSQLYALCAWKRNQNLKKIKVIFVYLDQGTKTEAVWKAGHMPRFFKTWDAKGKEITSCTSFKPKPNKYSCRYCDYQQSCDFAIKEGDL
jgi:CRISPR/Cas system-associated exonuclease Cas4 (RecB family)